jgi:hypothetical protein
MENKLPENLSRKISDEVQAAYSNYQDKDDESHYETFEAGYTAAAEAILSNPRAFGLAGAWVRGDKAPFDIHSTDLHWRIASTKEPLHKHQYRVIDKLRIDFAPMEDGYNLDELEYLSESAPPVDKVGELVNKAASANPILEDMRAIVKIIEANKDYNPAQTLFEITQIATNAVKQYKQ